MCLCSCCQHTPKVVGTRIELHALEARRLSNDDCVPEAFHQRPSCLYGTYPSSRQQQQRQHSPAPHSHYTQSIAANMADKMDVDAVVADKQVEASGPAPEKAPERSTYNHAAIAIHDQVLIACHSHNRQLRPPRTGCRDLRRPFHPPRAPLHLHHPQGQGLSDRHPHSHPHRLPQFEQPGEESAGRTPPAKRWRSWCDQGREGDR